MLITFRFHLSISCSCNFHGPVRLSCPGLFRLVSACFLSQNTIKSAEISRLSDQPNTPHDTISQQLHCRFRPYVSRKAATPSQSASHNPLIPIREMLGANKTTCPLPQCGTSKCHQTPIFKSNPSPVRAGRIQRVPCFQTQAFYIWARFWLQFLGIYNFF